MRSSPGRPPPGWCGGGGVPIKGAGLAGIAKEAVRAARDAANAASPAVFAPPIATFTGPRKAGEADLANGIAISVELDAGDIARSRGTLEGLLGTATVVV